MSVLSFEEFKKKKAEVEEAVTLQEPQVFHLDRVVDAAFTAAFVHGDMANAKALLEILTLAVEARTPWLTLDQAPLMPYLNQTQADRDARYKALYLAP
jgi:hypothetical protein